MFFYEILYILVLDNYPDICPDEMILFSFETAAKYFCLNCITDCSRNNLVERPIFRCHLVVNL